METTSIQYIVETIVGVTLVKVQKGKYLNLQRPHDRSVSKSAGGQVSLSVFMMTSLVKILTVERYLNYLTIL